MKHLLSAALCAAAAACLLFGAEIFHAVCPVCKGNGCARCKGTGTPTPERVEGYLLLALALIVAAAVVAL